MMNLLRSLISFAVLSSIKLACCSSINQSFQPLQTLQVDSRGDSSSWIVGKFCTDPDGGEPMIFFKDFIGTTKNLETAKKECADGCDSNEDCKYAEILWIPKQVQYCSFWTKDECKLVDNGFKNSYNYKKQ